MNNLPDLVGGLAGVAALALLLTLAISWLILPLLIVSRLNKIVKHLARLVQLQDVRRIEPPSAPEGHLISPNEP
ncbi:MAG TPA: hypothetical protein VN578_11005 [Candidatus Binatia bacterium]|jgi:hypothetical protein|nr:hypothetical protein [Candidatus Binatia bacterium]